MDNVDGAALVNSQMSEADLLKQVIELAETLGWLQYHVLGKKHYARVTSKGFPDLVLVRPPRVIFAELKSERGYMSPSQAGWAAEFRACPGIEWYLWRPSVWDVIVATLEGA